MENIRLAVRQSIQAGDLKEPVMLDENADHTSELISLYALWMDVSAHLAQDAVCRPRPRMFEYLTRLICCTR